MLTIAVVEADDSPQNLKSYPSFVVVIVLFAAISLSKSLEMYFAFFEFDYVNYNIFISHLI